MKRTKKAAFVTLMALCLTGICLLATGCGGSKPESEVAVVCSAAGKNDNGYNQSAIRGLSQVAESLKLGTKVVETSDSLSVPDALKQLASSGTKLIFSLEYDFDALVNGVGGAKPLAEQFPKTTFVVFNANPNVDANGATKFKNVISVLFDVHEASFMAGYLSVYVNENLAVLFDSSAYAFNGDKATNRKLGFIGGTASEGIQVFSYGYMEGASYAAGELGVQYSYMSKYDAGFGDAAVGASFAGSCYTAGANLVYAVAGNVGTGVTSKAADAKRLAIEVDANKDSVRPGNILTSVLKNTDVPVLAITKAYKEGKIASLGNLVSYDLGSGATGITDLATISASVKADGRALWGEITAKTAAVADKIKTGQISVTNAQAGEKFNPAAVKNLSYTTETAFASR